MKVGIIGLGKMGAAIAQRLRDEAVDVIGWDADPGACAAFSQSGGHLAGSAGEVAASADTVVSIITDDAGVTALYCGRGGLLSPDAAGKVFIDMSTVPPDTGHLVARNAAEIGVAFVGAPVMGTIPSARSGQLLALAGGTSADLELAVPVLSLLTRRVAHLGDAGSGYAAKLSVNLLMSAYLQGLTEALALGTRSGLETETLLDLFAEGPMATKWLDLKRPFFLGEDGPPSLDIRSLRKDVMAAVATGADLGVPMPGAAATLATLSAAVAQGEGTADLARMVRFFQDHMIQRLRFE